jgi:Type II secretion system (T2SS), protein F
MGSPLLLTGVGALFLSVIVGVTALVPASGRSAVAKTVKTADKKYRINPPASRPRLDARPYQLPAPVRAVGRALTPRGMIGSISRRLDLAGNPTWLDVDEVLAAKGLLLFVGAVMGFVIGWLFAGPLVLLLFVIVGAAIGFFAPDLFVLHLAQQRQDEIRRTLPDIIDTLVVTVEAGLGFEAAVAEVVHNGRGPLVGEFARVLHEMQIGRPRVDALREMMSRTNVVELKAFASSVVQATSLGIPMAKVLRQQSAEMRVRRRQRAEELAQKVPIKLLFPMIFCIFPAIFVVVIGPGVIQLMDLFGQ